LEELEKGQSGWGGKTRLKFILMLLKAF
jgi:hypothetical protein